MSLKKVAVIVLNYKLKELTLKALLSVKKSNYKNLLIIVVDNNSGDSLSEDIKAFKDVLFIQNDQNLGFSGGNNVGILEALKQGVDYCFILNPDAEVRVDTIKNLVDGAISAGASIAGPKVYFSDSNKIWYGGGVFDVKNVLGSHRGVDEEDRGQYDIPLETDFVTGAAMLISKDVFDKVGLFDERYFLYYEDSDLCYRAKLKGFKIMYIPKSVVYHANAKSTGLGSPLQDYYITRNRLLFASKFLSMRTRLALIREALRNLGISARRKALVDFLIGNLGKGSI